MWDALTHFHTWLLSACTHIWSKVTQSCLTLCDLMDYSLQVSSVHGIFQARIQEQVAISYSKGSSGPRDQTCISCTGRCILYYWAAWEATHLCRLIDSWVSFSATSVQTQKEQQLNQYTLFATFLPLPFLAEFLNTGTIQLEALNSLWSFQS